MPLNEDVRRVLTEDIEVVGSGVAATPIDPKMFYRGFSGDWYPIVNDLDCPRDIADAVLIEVMLNDQESRPADLIVLKAEAGAGKSVLLRRLAWRTSVELHKPTVWARHGSGLDRRAIEAIGPGLKERLYLFVDDVADHASSVASVLALARKKRFPLTVISAERSNEWNVRASSLFPFVEVESEYEVPRLEPGEIHKLLALLAKHSSLGELTTATESDQVQAFLKVADRQLLVALHVATQGKPLEEIIKDEYDKLVPESAQSLYLTVCLLNRTGTPVRAGLISRVHGISFEAFQGKFFRPLEHVVIANPVRQGRDIEYSARHPLIASLVVEQVLVDREELYERVVMVLRHLNTLYKTDQQSFRALINAHKLRKLFPDPRMIEQIYEVALETAPSDGHVVFQRAMFEMKRDSGSFERARELLSQAEEMLGRTPIVQHAFAELEYERAQRSTDPLHRAAALRDADGHLRNIPRHSETPHASHTKCKIQLLRLKNVLEDPQAIDEDKVRAVQHAENAISAALQQWPDETYILDSEASLATLLEQDERARRALERAAEMNPRNVTVVSRLIRMYKAKGERQKAKELLRIASEALPSERKYHFERALMLMEDDGDPELIERLLRKSFSQGDSNRKAQFLYARQMYINGKEHPARDRFRQLGAGGGRPPSSLLDQGVWCEETEPKEFRGKVTRVERGHGFVERDGTGDWVYVPRGSDGTHPLIDLEVGERVRFNITFNLRGPMAINVARA